MKHAWCASSSYDRSSLTMSSAMRPFCFLLLSLPLLFSTVAQESATHEPRVPTKSIFINTTPTATRTSTISSLFTALINTANDTARVLKYSTTHNQTDSLLMTTVVAPEHRPATTLTWRPILARVDYSDVWMISLIVVVSCMLLCLTVTMSRRCAREEIERKNGALLFGKRSPGLSGVSVMTIDESLMEKNLTTGGVSRSSTRSAPPSYETVVAPGYVPAGNNVFVVQPARQ
ncbi:hypothetical protein RvY_15085 [Ramazzottius varieornatus]|uniref:Membrane-associated protein n=1 Tax=Ramazzottius varieornatus TaxID=947166 RepID=A0A1D1VTN3_RAMVA|nr:hypothetical protein RvY_15085 [Ramazzottius varieornatus]